jgi:hypothetical protein
MSNEAMRVGRITDWHTARRVWELAGNERTRDLPGGTRPLRRPGHRGTGKHTIELEQHSQVITIWMWNTPIAQFSPCGAMLFDAGYYGHAPTTRAFVHSLLGPYATFALANTNTWVRETPTGVIVGAARDYAPLGCYDAQPSWDAFFRSESWTVKSRLGREPEFLFPIDWHIEFDRDAAAPQRNRSTV